MQRIIRLAAGGGVAALFVLLLPLVVAAHERRDIMNGQYSVVVGFLDEPAFVGEKNGLWISIAKHDPAASPTAEAAEAMGIPVLGLDQTLQAEVIFGDQTMELPLTPAFGEPGAYESVFFPMAEGDYTFHISGEIEGTAIDETFTSSPEGFSSVEPREPLEFPKGEAATDGAAAATVADWTAGVAGGPAAGLLAGAIGLAAGGVLLAGRAAVRRRLAPAPLAARVEPRA